MDSEFTLRWQKRGTWQHGQFGSLFLLFQVHDHIGLGGKETSQGSEGLKGTGRATKGLAGR